jgi:DNA-binding response OmpR family regulator
VATVRVLVAADKKNYRSDGLIETLSRHGILTYLISPENLTPDIIGDPDVILVLDERLPYDKAVAHCRQIRMDSSIPIIMMTNRSDRNSRVNALRSGADDYVTTPSDDDEIIAKIFAVAGRRGRERTPGRSEPGDRLDDMTIDLNRMRATVGDKTVELTKKEFQTLLLLAGADGAVCSREKIAAEVWGRPESDVYDSIQVVMSRLRAKLGHERIETVRSVGYQLAAPGSQPRERQLLRQVRAEDPAASGAEDSEPTDPPATIPAP